MCGGLCSAGAVARQSSAKAGVLLSLLQKLSGENLHPSPARAPYPRLDMQRGMPHMVTHHICMPNSPGAKRANIRQAAQCRGAALGNPPAGPAAGLAALVQAASSATSQPNLDSTVLSPRVLNFTLIRLGT